MCEHTEQPDVFVSLTFAECYAIIKKSKPEKNKIKTR